MQSVFPKDVLQNISETLKANYSFDEAESLAFIILEHVFGLTQTAVLLNEKIEFNRKDNVQQIVARLMRNEPIQHILGCTEFYSRKFIVNEHVLIPRQETEELIHLIKAENKSRNLRILDIGTGSGCIACSLSLEMNDAEVFALDVSQKALEIARRNSKNLKCNVSFIHSDVLRDQVIEQNLDIIVSNPPYVTEKEKEQMHQNVLDYEPENALFVSNENPLIFYKAITQKSEACLKAGGKLYLEINELFGKEVAFIMEQNNFIKVKIHRDLNGKERFVSGFFKNS